MRMVLAVILGGAALLVSPVAAQSGDGWLDGPLVSWNGPGMAVPLAAAGEGAFGLNDPFCQTAIRPPETGEDAQIVAAGWTLVGTYEGGWGVSVVLATTGFDGMCRPMGYQHFVFADGRFAGTTSPHAMASRTSGAGLMNARFSADALSARFVRYASTDALCCPSLPSVTVRYRLDRTELGPVLVPVAATTG